LKKNRKKAGPFPVLQSVLQQFIPLQLLDIVRDRFSMQNTEQSSIENKDSAANPDSQQSKPSRLKAFASMVKDTVVVMRKIQVVNLNDVLSAQSRWRSASKGYQNLFEFGDVPFTACGAASARIRRR
jgi:hypothetical protein